MGYLHNYLYWTFIWLGVINVQELLYAHHFIGIFVIDWYANQISMVCVHIYMLKWCFIFEYFVPVLRGVDRYMKVHLYLTIFCNKCVQDWETIMVITVNEFPLCTLVWSLVTRSELSARFNQNISFVVVSIDATGTKIMHFQKNLSWKHIS